MLFAIDILKIKTKCNFGGKIVNFEFDNFLQLDGKKKGTYSLGFADYK